MNSAMPGKNRNNGLLSIQSEASEIIRPHDAVGSLMPTPRNDSAASAVMLVGSSRVV